VYIIVQKIGGLSKLISRVALFAAAGLFVGGVAMPSAKAADLGGDCCADLEERVAELEATTVRKGNRKVSLTLYGWVNKGIMYWNDGSNSNTYFGVDNTNYATRFGMRGDARVSPNMTVGFNLLADIITGANSGPTGVNQLREDATLPANGPLSTSIAIAGSNAYAEDSIIRFRDANVWIEDKNLGRLTVGHLTNPGPQGIIDLGGTAVAAPAALDLMGGAFIFRNSKGQFSSATIGNNVLGNNADFSHRTDSIRWDSPTVAGFVLSAAYGEALNTQLTPGGLDAKYNPLTTNGPIGSYWAVALRYAGEFSGFRVAAAAAYEESDAEERMNSSQAATAGKTFLKAHNSNNTGLSASLLHVQSGLFAQGSWIRSERPNHDLAIAGGATNTDTGSIWQIQGGISQNWFGIGKTVLYGEYAKAENYQRTFSSDLASNQANTGTEYTMWGLGVVQNIDAAATEIYLAYRRHSVDRAVAAGTAINAANDCATNGLGCVTGLPGASLAGANSTDLQDIHILFGGVRIAF
jgi:hypothetical protein